MKPSALRSVAPNLSAARAGQIAKALGPAMQSAGITTLKRVAAFIAQLAHESGGFYYQEELASGDAYEGRSDLGNTQPGDGRRYKGRGWIQLTGRANYRSAGRDLGLNLEGNPGLAKTDSGSARIAVWFWNSRGLNALADRGDFRGITYRINGGYNGWNDRVRYWERAKAVAAGLSPEPDPFSYLASREARLIREAIKIRKGASRRGRWLLSERARLTSIKTYLRTKVTALKAKRRLTDRERKRLGYLRDGVAGRELE